MIGKVIAEHLMGILHKDPKPGVQLNVGDTVVCKNWDDSLRTSLIVYLDLQADLVVEQDTTTGECWRGPYGYLTHEIVKVLPAN